MTQRNIDAMAGGMTRIVLDFFDGNDCVDSWSVETQMSSDVFVDWLHNILSDQETYGLDITRVADE